MDRKCGRLGHIVEVDSSIGPRRPRSDKEDVPSKAWVADLETAAVLQPVCGYAVRVSAGSDQSYLLITMENSQIDMDFFNSESSLEPEKGGSNPTATVSAAPTPKAYPDSLPRCPT